MIVPTTEIVTDFSKVDAQLEAIYRRALGVQGDVAPVVRTALFNLVVYVCTTQEADQAALNVSEIVSAKPCRAIIADATPTVPGGAAGQCVGCLRDDQSR